VSLFAKKYKKHHSREKQKLYALPDASFLKSIPFKLYVIEKSVRFIYLWKFWGV
jgi:hypothetical protein